MGLFDKVNERLAEQRKSELQALLIDGEQIKADYQLAEDFCGITNKRIIFVDKGWVSTKKAIHSIPIANITAVSLIRSGYLAFTKEVEIVAGLKIFELKFFTEVLALEFYNAIIKEII